MPTTPTALRRSPLFWLNVLAAVLLLTWLWVAPRRAWDQVLLAIDTGNAKALSDVIDMPRLQTNLRTDLQVALINQAGVPAAISQGEESQGMLNSLVEAASTPTAIEETLSGFGYRRNEPTRPEMSFHYRSPIRVEVWMGSPTAPSTERGIFTMQLVGTSWRLVRMRSVWLMEKSRT